MQYINNVLEQTPNSLNIQKGACVNAYLILIKEDEVLLHLRQNTGYYDGFYGFVSGHVEDGESATAAMVREAKEEADIDLEPLQLDVVHIMHRKTDRLNVDIFFASNQWQGNIINREPEKCVEIKFFSIHKLPENTMEYNIRALKAMFNQEFYSEEGWSG